MAVFHTKAIILRHSTDREHDRLLSVLTPNHGQLRITLTSPTGTRSILQRFNPYFALEVGGTVSDQSVVNFSGSIPPAGGHWGCPSPSTSW